MSFLKNPKNNLIPRLLRWWDVFLDLLLFLPRATWRGLLRVMEVLENFSLRSLILGESSGYGYGYGYGYGSKPRARRPWYNPMRWLAAVWRLVSSMVSAFFNLRTEALMPQSATYGYGRARSKIEKAIERHNLARKLLALPAIFALLGWLGILGLVLWFNPARVEARYTQWADDAYKIGHYPRARVASERLLQLDSTNHHAHLLRLAKNLAAMGYADDALALASRAAQEKQGLENMQLEVAEAIVSNPGASSNLLHHAERHLLHLFAGRADNADAAVLLGRYYFRVGDWEEARWYLKRAFPKRNDAGLVLAAIEMGYGNELARDRWAAAASEYFKVKTLSGRPNDPKTWMARRQWTEAELLQGNLTNALNILQEGIASTGLKIYHRIAASIYCDLVKRSWILDPTNSWHHLELLKTGLAHDPQNEFLLRALAAVANGQGALAEAALSYARELGASEANRPHVYYYLGMDQYNRGNIARARNHLEVAWMGNQDNPVLGNNFAYLLAITDPPDYPRSLTIINGIIEQYPKEMIFRETRGQILLKMQRWADALSDLEAALPLFKSNSVIHASLAKAYAGLGRTDRSAQHEKISRELRAAELREATNAP